MRVAAISFIVVACALSCRAREAVPADAGPVVLAVDGVTPEMSAAQVQAKGAPEENADAAPRPQAPPARWATWPMPNFASSGLPNQQSYDLNVGGTVLDLVTGLMWQRKVHPENVTFDAANAKCAALELDGYRDWRLPSRIELVSILDLAETEPSIERNAFPFTPSDWFWSSSLAADSPTSAWYVYFYFGYPKTDDRSSPFRIRCVRTEKPPPFTADPDTHYQVGLTGVHDLATGLTWQRGPSSRDFEFQAGLEYCGHLNLDGHHDWRLPSMPELLSLVDERASGPAIDAVAFPRTSALPFWTGSLFGNKPAEAWYVDFEHGYALYGLLKATHRVRCVR